MGSCCLLTLMLVREKGTQAAAGSISRGSQTGLGSLFPFTDSSSHRQQHTDNLISLTTSGVSSKMCSQVWWKVWEVRDIMDFGRTKQETRRKQVQTSPSVTAVAACIWQPACQNSRCTSDVRGVTSSTRCHSRHVSVFMMLTQKRCHIFKPWLKNEISCLREGCVKSGGHFRGYKNMKLLLLYRPSNGTSPHFLELFIEAPLQ